MRQAIIGYHLDDENHWVARLECQHFQHTSSAAIYQSAMGYKANHQRCHARTAA